MARGTLYIISGPSGAGKGTIVQGVLERRPQLKLAVSSTTRPARPMEKEGVHYHFISAREFTSRRDRGEFLEWAEVHGNMYGTPKGLVEDELSRGNDVLLEVDVQGAAQVKARVPEAKLIFIEAPSMQVLEERLRGRQTDQQEAIERRIADAHEELRRKNAFDGVIVNLYVDESVEEVLKLMDRLKGEKPE